MLTSLGSGTNIENTRKSESPVSVCGTTRTGSAIPSSFKSIVLTSLILFDILLTSVGKKLSSETFACVVSLSASDVIAGINFGSRLSVRSIPSFSIASGFSWSLIPIGMFCEVYLDTEESRLLSSPKKTQ